MRGDIPHRGPGFWARLTDAAKELAAQPTSITLRYLQTLTEIGAEKNTTVVFPLPIDILKGIARQAATLTDSDKSE